MSPCYGWAFTRCRHRPTLRTDFTTGDQREMEWNELGFRPPLCTWLSWVMKTSWGWWDEWDDTALQTQGLKFATWRSESEHAISRSRSLPTILNLYEWTGKKHFVYLKLEGQSGVRTCDLRLLKQAALTIAPGHPPWRSADHRRFRLCNVNYKKIWIFILAS